MEDTARTLKVNLGNETLQMLKQSGYKICIAKKTGNADYGVIWQAYDQYLNINTFTWRPAYQIFITNSPLNSAANQAASNPVDIAPGEQVTLDEYGILGEAVGGSVADSIVLENKYGAVYVGLNQSCTGFDGNDRMAINYMSETALLEGTISLQPMEKVLVWFEQDPGGRITPDGTKIATLEVDFTGKSEVTMEYDCHEGWKMAGLQSNQIKFLNGDERQN